MISLGPNAWVALQELHPDLPADLKCGCVGGDGVCGVWCVCGVFVCMCLCGVGVSVQLFRAQGRGRGGPVGARTQCVGRRGGSGGECQGG